MIVKVNVPLVPVDGPEKTNTGYSYTVKESYFKSLTSYYGSAGFYLLRYCL